MEDLPEGLVTEVLKKITRTSDLNSFSLVSKQLYKMEGNQRGAICLGSGLSTATEALASLCARFPNLWKVEIDCSGWIYGHEKHMDNKGLFVFSSLRSSLIDLTLSFCSYIDALAQNCRMLQTVDLKFEGCDSDWPSEIGFTQKGFLALIQSSPIRVLVLNTANFLDDEGTKALSSSPHMETLELIFCPAVTNAGMRFIAHTPCLRNLTLRVCHEVNDVGVAELGREKKLSLWSLSIVVRSLCKLRRVLPSQFTTHSDYSADLIW